MRCIKVMAILLVLLMAVPIIGVSDADDTSDSILFDMGNGVVHWYDITSSGDVKDLTTKAAGSLGLEISYDAASPTSIGGMGTHNVGTQSCTWLFYIWKDGSWVHSSVSDYQGGSFAWGFYPDASITPVVTPSSRTAWTMHRIDSSSSGSSDSYGTTDAKAPVEWYRTYTSGYVDSSIVCAGNLLYHTTGGEYGATGPDRNPWVFCIDRFTGEEVWSYMMTYGQGYEVTSPVIIGDMVIVTATNWNIYCFDRFTGDLLHKLVLDSTFPLDANGDVVWEGRIFYTGATTPVYDSGALYFGTANGHVMAYSVTREKGFVQLWDYDPDDSVSGGRYVGVKGCFYFHAPVITDVNGTRMLFIGSYEGYVYALDTSTGKEMWVKRVINLGEDNIPHKGTPGSAAGISVLSDGRLLVECTDGGMSPQDGYVICIDALTGMGPEGTDHYWKIDALFGGPVSTDGGFYAYVQTSSKGPNSLEKQDGSSVDLVKAVYMFDNDGKVVWRTEECGWIKSALTLADGVIYTVDYSAGVFWPTGGGVTAYSAEDGSQIWRIRLTPYANDSYSMVTATVIDGRIYVGNDYGAIYCISDIAGPEYGDDGEITLGNGFLHWSWAVLVAVAIIAVIALLRFY